MQVQKKINYLIGNLTVSNSLVANRMEINGIINAALAAPVRNCDVGTAEEQEMSYIDYCSRHRKSDPHCDPCRGCPLYLKPSGCQFSWAQMPYEAQEGAGK